MHHNSFKKTWKLQNVYHVMKVAHQRSYSCGIYYLGWSLYNVNCCKFVYFFEQKFYYEYLCYFKFHMINEHLRLAQMVGIMEVWINCCKFNPPHLPKNYLYMIYKLLSFEYYLFL